jgi:hypothetical protein
MYGKTIQIGAAANQGLKTWSRDEKNFRHRARKETTIPVCTPTETGVKPFQEQLILQRLSTKPPAPPALAVLIYICET